jgi:hypothetical protein
MCATGFLKLSDVPLHYVYIPRNVLINSGQSSLSVMHTHFFHVDASIFTNLLLADYVYIR